MLNAMASHNPPLNPATLRHYAALADWLSQRVGKQACPIVGINGAQGSGKSSLTHFLVNDLATRHGLRCGWLSLDDCYLGRGEREQLAREVHPLLTTRGVPGTHDVTLGRALLGSLQSLRADESLRLPVFSKAQDDRLPESDWREVTGPFDLILFEGWCVGIPPQPETQLMQPVNDLERLEDTAGRWRTYVNTQLAGPYAEWFAMLDACIFLQVPGVEQVQVWRGQQEVETRAVQGSGPGSLDAVGLARFIQHYERLTRHALTVMPEVAEVCLTLGADHTVIAARY